MKLIVANLKMYMDYNGTKDYIKKVKKQDNFVVVPSYIYVPLFLESNFITGVQNCYYENCGAYTGEISPLQLNSMGVECVILGHSERRTYFDETDDIINKKVAKSIDNNLKVILCIGESEDCSNKEEFLKGQLLKCLKDVSLDNIIIAYEPIWAIGTGKIPTMEEIKDTSLYIKRIVKENFNADIKVLYGGSVSANNIEELNKINEIEGFLIGSASSKVDEINKIITSIN